MSIDGVVHCACVEQGLATEPPCPIVLDDQPWVYAAPGFEGYSRQVSDWAKNACPHPDFALAEEQLHRVTLLETIAGHGGAESFPALTGSLPTLEGSFAPETSAACLGELDRLAELMRAESTMAVLIDSDSGQIVHVNRSDNGLVSLMRFPAGSPRIVEFDHLHRMSSTEVVDPKDTTTWMTPDAMVHVRSAISGEVCFSSREFIQELSGEGWVFRDVASGQSVQHSSPITFWDLGVEYWPARLRGEVAPTDLDAFVPGVAGLRSLLTASVRTEHPVIWY